MSARENSIKPQVKELRLPYLGEIPFDPKVEEAIGNPEMLQETGIAQQIKKIVTRTLNRELDT